MKPITQQSPAQKPTKHPFIKLRLSTPRLAQKVTTLLAGILGGIGLISIPASIAPRQASAEDVIVPGQPMTLLADVQEANAVTGVVTARGNVQIFYPARNMQATAIQAQYYSREGRIVLNGDVFILQDGNSIQGEVVTYLIEEGRFVALPNDGDQVQSVYLVEDEDAPENGGGSVNQPVFNPKPEFKTPISP
ncbi:MAG: hypothetical protein F6K09_18945 [Merismopedia sp. SIO2A8]|nr:hypothetical protein [Symploca sp. SIO2B6]NET50723.1 hypothetical protein [Merismopedia sp. SIO2A8]